MATATAIPEVFTRKASGLVRVMSPYSAFVYNILTMGLIFPWTYLWAPGALPGGRLVWGILLAMLIEIPIAFAYVWLSTALPRSGGDYVFESRVFGGGTAFTVVMSGYVIWILQWVALSGWLLSYLGFAPLFLGLGATMQSPGLSNLGVWFTTVDRDHHHQHRQRLRCPGDPVLRLQELRPSAVGDVVCRTDRLWRDVRRAVLHPAGAVRRTAERLRRRLRWRRQFLPDGGRRRRCRRDRPQPAALSLLATLLVAPIAWTSLAVGHLLGPAER